MKETAKELTAKDVVAATAAGGAKKPEGIMVDGQAEEDDDDVVVDDSSRLADAVRADGKGGSDADPQSKLVKDILSRQAEQEVRSLAPSQSQAQLEEKKEAEEAAKNGAGGIRLGRLRKTGAEKKGAVGGGLGEGDMERLRGAVQLLVQHTGPLGTCMDFIQEDVGLMGSELHKWEEECRRYDAVVEEERRKSNNLLQPLQQQLLELEEQINDKIARISSVKASIARNEEKVQQCLKLVSSV